MADNTIRIHELTEVQDADEAGLIKQQSRFEEARKLREAREHKRDDDAAKPAR